jgi:transcriptional regulator with XRE-family HTH domain
MSTINERVRELRKTLKLSGEKFGIAIGIKKTSVSLIERGINNPSEQTLLLIMEKFGVNEKWLREGAGEMFAEKDEAARIIEETGTTNPFVIELVQLVTKLSYEHRLQVLADVEALAAKYGHKEAGAEIVPPEKEKSK